MGDIGEKGLGPQKGKGLADRRWQEEEEKPGGGRVWGAGWGQRVGVAGRGVARKGGFLFLKAGKVSVGPSVPQGLTQPCFLPVGFEI